MVAKVEDRTARPAAEEMGAGAPRMAPPSPAPGTTQAPGHPEDEHPWPYRPLGLALMALSAGVTILLFYGLWRLFSDLVMG